MEIWDGYLNDGTLANQDLVRGEPIPKGLYHLVSEILVRHVDGDYLLTRRDIRKNNYGGWYEATAGGAALKGENKVSCAKRELLEETGITSGDFKEIGHYISNDTIYYSFYVSPIAVRHLFPSRKAKQCRTNGSMKMISSLL